MYLPKYLLTYPPTFNYLSICLEDLCSAASKELHVLRATPSPGPRRNKSLSEAMEGARRIMWKRMQFKREVVPDSGASRREGPVLLF